jgi:DNA invertase Pin-like site-specific DNA recombinase
MSCIPPHSRVFGYARDSGGDDQTIDDQNNAITAYCDEHNLVLVHLFVDRARPGSTSVGREQFEAMIQLVRTAPMAQLPDGVIFWSLSRFARDYDDSQFFKADLRRRGLILESIADDIPSDGAHARLIEAVIDWKNEQFLEDLRQDVKRGLHDIARQGYAPGGFPPRGYLAEKVVLGTRNDGTPHVVSRWIPDPKLAPLVKLAWEMRTTGASYREIHEETQIYGSYNSYSCMFRNKTYLGIRKCGNLEVEDAHEPLITQETWEAVQETLKTRKGPVPKGQPAPRTRNSSFLLSGMARCAYCGSAMSGSTANRKTRPNPWPYYLCGAKKRQGWDSCEGRMLNAKTVEQAVMDTVLNRVMTPEFVEMLIEGVNEAINQDLITLDLQIEETRHRLDETERAISNLLDLAETFGARAAGDRIIKREHEREELTQKLLNLEMRRTHSTLKVSDEVVLDVISGARATLTGDDIKARRAILRQFVDHVEMANEGGRLHYTFPLEIITPPTLLLLVPPRVNELKECQITW